MQTTPPTLFTRRSRGFSLTELMVAVSIMLLIIFALYGIFNKTQKALRDNISQVDILESGRAAMELIGREMEQVAASGIGGMTNFYAFMIPSQRPPLRHLDLDQERTLRTNYLQDLFFLTRMTNIWTGVGYRVGRADDGVGTLYRYSISTNAHRLHTNHLAAFFWNEPVFRDAERKVISTNLHRVADGIIHFRAIAFDSQGRRLGYDTTNGLASYQVARMNSSGGLLPYSSAPDLQSADLILSPEPAIPLASRMFFRGGALPAYVELELGVLDPEVLRQYESLRGTPGAATFLQNRVNKVHIFRQRIPIRTARQ
jgi:prepilin-type N-terminal cleavage/methylation domain-containing protein